MFIHRRLSRSHTHTSTICDFVWGFTSRVITLVQPLASSPSSSFAYSFEVFSHSGHEGRLRTYQTQCRTQECMHNAAHRRSSSSAVTPWTCHTSLGRIDRQKNSMNAKISHTIPRLKIMAIAMPITCLPCCSPLRLYGPSALTPS